MEIPRIPILVVGATLLAALVGSIAGKQLGMDRRGHDESRPQEWAALDVTGPASADQLTSIRAIAQEQFDRKDYATAVRWAQRYIKAGGAEADVRPLLVQAYLRTDDFANAARELQWEVRAAERAGVAPGEDRLLLLRDCYAKLNDANAFAWLLEKLVTYYPKKEYWADLLDRTERRPDFGAALALDVNRLRLLTGVLSSPQAWFDYAAQARQAGFAAEAKAALQEGIARGVLANSPDVQRTVHQYSIDAQEQQKRIADPRTEQAATRASDGIELMNLGYAHVTFGNYAKGIALMEQGLRKGGGLANRPQIAKLHFAEALLRSGDKGRAIEVFITVGGRHGAADMGRIWAIHARNMRG